MLWCSLESTSEENEDNDSIKLVFNKSQVRLVTCLIPRHTILIPSLLGDTVHVLNMHVLRVHEL